MGLPGAGRGDDAPTGTVTLPGGLEVPESLSALLGLSNAHLSGVLVRAFVESTTDLLTLSEDGRRYLKGTGEAFWRKLTRELATRWPGVELGCLAPAAAPPERRPHRETKAEMFDRLLGVGVIQ